MIVCGISENTRYKNLDHFGLLTKILQKDWVDVTEVDLRASVANIMIKHGENGKEAGYSFVLKISLKAIVRFVKLGSRNKPEDGELSMLKFIKSKKPKGGKIKTKFCFARGVKKLLFLGVCNFSESQLERCFNRQTLARSLYSVWHKGHFCISSVNILSIVQ